jgi:hypothetical protein
MWQTKFCEERSNSKYPFDCDQILLHCLDTALYRASGTQRASACYLPSFVQTLRVCIVRIVCTSADAFPCNTLGSTLPYLIYTAVVM